MLKSHLFKGNARLERTLVSDPAHVVPGDTGPHVRDIQIALEYLDAAFIEESEIAAMRYGPSTAAAVLAYKQARQIINRAYQSSADNIVGKMTMARLDQEMFDCQYTPTSASRRGGCRSFGIRSHVAVVDPPMPQNLQALRESDGDIFVV